MPLRLAAQIEALLGPGENIEWQGRPVVPWRILVMASAAVATGCAVAVIAIWRGEVAAIGAWVFFLIATLSCNGVAATYAARNTAFALTNQRILICAYRFLRNRCAVTTYLPEELTWRQPTTARLPIRLSFLRCVTGPAKVQSLVCRTLLPQLALRLRNSDPAVRRRAANSFTRLGKAAAPYISDLLDALKSDDSIVRRRAAESLGNSGVAEVAAYLECIRFDDDRAVANAAVRALNRLSLSRRQ